MSSFVLAAAAASPLMLPRPHVRAGTAARRVRVARGRGGNAPRVRAASEKSADKTEGGSGSTSTEAAASEGGSLADMMAKLAAAEAEAEALRAELKQSAADAPPAQTVDELARLTPAKPKNRIDGVGGREMLFGGPKGGSDAWLKDGMDFLVREQPSENGEVEKAILSSEDQGTINRRLALGIFGTALFAGLSQISDTAPPPSKPLFFFLVPLVKTRELLKQASDLAENGYWDDLSSVCRQMSQTNAAKDNLFQAAAYLDSREEEKAKAIATDFLEILEKIDYNKYFESMKSVPVTGSKALEYSKFSKRAAGAAAAKLDEFFALMDREQLDAARSQVVGFSPPEPEPEQEQQGGGEPVVGDGADEAVAAAGGGFSSGYSAL